MVQPLRQLLAVSVWVTSSASLPLSPLVRGHLEVATPRRTCRWLIALQGSLQRHMAVHLPIRLPIPASGAPLFLQSSSAGLLRLLLSLLRCGLPACPSARLPSMCSEVTERDHLGGCMFESKSQGFWEGKKQRRHSICVCSRSLV